MTSDVCTDEYSSDYIFSGGLDYSVNAYNDYIASETGGYTGEDKNGYDACTYAGLFLSSWHTNLISNSGTLQES